MRKKWRKLDKKTCYWQFVYCCNSYAYNYTATIDIEDIDDSLKDKIIEFTVTGVDKWEEEIVNFTPTV